MNISDWHDFLNTRYHYLRQKCQKTILQILSSLAINKLHRNVGLLGDQNHQVGKNCTCPEFRTSLLSQQSDSQDSCCLARKGRSNKLWSNWRMSLHLEAHSYFGFRSFHFTTFVKLLIRDRPAIVARFVAVSRMNIVNTLEHSLQ
jgi:hypothetical protein